MIRAPVSPELLRWARERSGIAHEDMAARFRKLSEWEDGETQPTLKQLQRFARAVHVPVGYLFLSKPPEDTLPIPDFRTFAGHRAVRPSPNLLDTIYACEERQDWYRGYALANGPTELDFVGRATVDSSPETTAADMRETLGFNLADRRECRTWRDALRLLIRRAEEVGILVMVSGVVRSNNSRPLDPAEFRGFALSDPLAPVVFVNARDTAAAQMFTLAHELAHVWLGVSALSNLALVPRSGFRREDVWCGAVATEFLLPRAELHADLRQGEPLPRTLSRLARKFMVSKLVILRRLLDVGWIDRGRFDVAWEREAGRPSALAPGGAGGGDFYRTTLARVSRRFANALVASTLEGHTRYVDAYWMLGIRKAETFDKLGREVGVMR